MSAAPKTAQRFQRRPEARPEELLDSALTVFGERGYRATTLEEVAKHAGVSKGTVYLYFASKDDLFRAMVEKNVIAMIESAEARVREHTGSAAELLETMMRTMWAKLSKSQMVCVTRLVQSELPQFPEIQRYYWENVIVRHRRLLRAIVDRGIASGEFRPEAVAMVPTMVPALIVQLNHVRALFGGLDPDGPTPEDQIESILSLVFDGIRQRPALAQE
ncbi:MAG: TetR/AcrR family transcriptional regulator [Gemmatimonadota bacterium]